MCFKLSINALINEGNSNRDQIYLGKHILQGVKLQSVQCYFEDTTKRYIYASWETIYPYICVHNRESRVNHPPVRRPNNIGQPIHFETCIICNFYHFVTYVIKAGRQLPF